MRIFVASGIFHPEPGGPSTYLYHLLPRLQEREHDLTVLAFGDAPTDTYPYPLTRIPRRFYPLRQWDYYRAASKLWSGQDVAYLHSLGLPLPVSIKPRVLKVVGDTAWERAVNKGWIAPTFDIDTFQSTRFSPQVEADKLLRASEARQVDRVIVPSEYLKRMVISWGIDPSRIQVIYNALEADVLPTDNSIHPTAHPLGGGPILFIAARLTAWKGVDHCIEALARCQNKDAQLVIAGDSHHAAMRLRLEELAEQHGISNRVIFQGRIHPGLMHLYFKVASYTVLYSGYEGLSHVLLESLRSGTPIIASNKGGNPEVVQHGVNGLLVPYIDVDALTAAFDHALAHGVREALAANVCLDARFNVNTMLNQTEAALMEVAGA
jgi:glycosyltransferase involved in cell wall biosynthesis